MFKKNPKGFFFCIVVIENFIFLCYNLSINYNKYKMRRGGINYGKRSFPNY